tara:strand:+ start:12583 stop:13320 length:738 start_codon:yes stop_codon:yes gene_type:complete
MTALQNNTIVIKKETIKRLASDVKDLLEDPLENEGIYYIHNEDDILKGKALIIGAKNTPYKYGYYFFEFKFPTDYPFSPPKVSFHTNDGITRFNPNLYRNGKVCISVLNTWRGPQWTSCQTIRSVLLCLCGSVLNDEPLLNEPGITKDHIDYDNYITALRYKNYDIAIDGIINNIHIKHSFNEFVDIIKSNFIKNYDNIISCIEKDTIDNADIYVKIYKMPLTIEYGKIKKRLANTHAELLKFKN